jgi:SAM-dependent methyltransferase
MNKTSLRTRIKWALFPGFNLHARQRYRVLPRFFVSPKKGDTRMVLDAGCGNGMLSYKSYQKGNTVIGVTFKEDEARRCRTLFNDFLGIPESSLSFRVMNLRDISQLGQTFDDIICSEVLEHIRDDKGVAQNLVHCMKPGGTLHLCCPYSKHPDHASRALDLLESGDHVRHGYTYDDYEQIFAPLGLRIDKRYEVGGVWRQRINRQIINQGQRFGLVAEAVLWLIGQPLLWIDPLLHHIPYSIYAGYRRTENKHTT